MVCYDYGESSVLEAVFKYVAKSRGVDDKWHCDSAAIMPWEKGHTMDPFAMNVLKKRGLEFDNRTAHKAISKDHYFQYDYILATDIQTMNYLTADSPVISKANIEVLAAYDPNGFNKKFTETKSDEERFERVYEVTLRSCGVFIDNHTCRADKIIARRRNQRT